MVAQDWVVAQLDSGYWQATYDDGRIESPIHLSKTWIKKWVEKYVKRHK